MVPAVDGRRGNTLRPVFDRQPLGLLAVRAGVCAVAAPIRPSGACRQSPGPGAAERRKGNGYDGTLSQERQAVACGRRRTTGSGAFRAAPGQRANTGRHYLRRVGLSPIRCPRRRSGLRQDGRAGGCRHYFMSFSRPRLTLEGAQRARIVELRAKRGSVICPKRVIKIGCSTVDRISTVISACRNFTL